MSIIPERIEALRYAFLLSAFYLTPHLLPWYPPGIFFLHFFPLLAFLAVVIFFQKGFEEGRLRRWRGIPRRLKITTLVVAVAAGLSVVDHSGSEGSRLSSAG